MVKPKSSRLLIEIVILLASVGLTIWFVGSPAFNNLLTWLTARGGFGALISGIFYSSIFTSTPAVAALSVMSHTINPIALAIWAGIGAIIGEFIIYFTFGEHAGSQIGSWIAHHMRHHRRTTLKELGWLATILGLIIIATPLPDEIGLALMGVEAGGSALRILFLLPVNIVGIYTFISLGRHLV